MVPGNTRWRRSPLAAPRRKQIQQLEHSHKQAAIASRLAAGHRPSYVRDFVYGGIDGAITTFAIVAGVVGAALPAKVVLILGLANLVADGFSMAASNYSGTKSVVDDVERIREIERRHIRAAPEGEREEIRQILAQKGLEGETLEDAVEAVTSDEGTWVEMMVADEYGLSPNQSSPLHAALATFAAFFVCGAVPLAPFAIGLGDSIAISTAATAVVFFVIGALKSQWSLAPWWQSGLETLFIGSIAAALAFAVGHGFHEVG